MKPTFRRRLVVAIITALLPGSAGAVIVGQGTFVLDYKGDSMNNQVCQFFTFQNQNRDVYGTQVNLSTAFGTGVLCTASTTGGVPSGTLCESYPTPDKWHSTATAVQHCYDGMCLHSSFVSLAADITGTLPDSLGPGITYSADGEQDIDSIVGSTSIPGCAITAGTIYHFVGDISINAFKAVTTSVGADQEVSFPAVTFYNPYTNATESVDVAVTFSGVVGAGATTVSAVSTPSADIPANFAFSMNGYNATFLEIETTASIMPPIEVCTIYADEDNDGFLDGTAPPVDESSLSIMHGENGAFVDRTSSRDPVTNTICASVDTLSPFGVMIRTNASCSNVGDPCDDGNACTTGDACNGGLECVGNGTLDCSDGDICTQDVCVAPGGCAHPPAVQVACDSSNTKGSLLIKNNALDTKDLFKFSWSSGTIPLADLGTPTVSTSYTVCASDADTVLASAVAPASSTCGTLPCWTESTKGVKYLDKAKPGANDGVSQISGIASTLGKAKLQVKAGGETMKPISLGGITYPVTVQIITNGGKCWEQSFVSGDEKTSTVNMLKLSHKDE